MISILPSVDSVDGYNTNGPNIIILHVKISLWFANLKFAIIYIYI